MADFETILSGIGVKVTASALDRAYDGSGSYLARIWERNRDVPVSEHVRAILGAVEPALPARVPADIMSALVEAYARPVLLVWAPEKDFFPWEHAQRLARTFPDARVERVDDSYTFVSEDQPERLATLIGDFARRPVTA